MTSGLNTNCRISGPAAPQQKTKKHIRLLELRSTWSAATCSSFSYSCVCVQNMAEYLCYGGVFLLKHSDFYISFRCFFFCFFLSIYFLYLYSFFSVHLLPFYYFVSITLLSIFPFLSQNTFKHNSQYTHVYIHIQRYMRVFAASPSLNIQNHLKVVAAFMSFWS